LLKIVPKLTRRSSENYTQGSGTTIPELKSLSR
jgi:hypothetical protein